MDFSGEGAEERSEKVSFLSKSLKQPVVQRTLKRVGQQPLTALFMNSRPSNDLPSVAGDLTRNQGPCPRAMELGS